MTLTTNLDAARRALTERAETHGDPFVVHERIAQLWSAYLQVWVEPAQVAGMLLLMKLARSEQNPAYQDNFVDIMGYAAIMGELSQKRPARATLDAADGSPDTAVPKTPHWR